MEELGMTKYRFSDGAAIVFGGSGGLGSGIVDLLSKMSLIHI